MAKPTPQTCPVCNAPARLAYLTHHDRRRAGKRERPYWLCEPCNTSVGCHPGTTRPLGTLATRAVREARIELHFKIDAIWRSAPAFYGEDGSRNALALKRMARKRVYAFLADRLRLTRAACHVGCFDEALCKRAENVIWGVTYADVREHAHKIIRQGIG